MTTPRTAALRSRMAALTGAQPSDVLLESWITLARQLAAWSPTASDRQVPPADRAAVSHAMDTIQRVLEGRGMDVEEFDTLDWLITMEAGDR